MKNFKFLDFLFICIGAILSFCMANTLLLKIYLKEGIFIEGLLDFYKVLGAGSVYLVVTLFVAFVIFMLLQGIRKLIITIANKNS